MSGDVEPLFDLSEDKETNETNGMSRFRSSSSGGVASPGELARARPDPSRRQIESTDSLDDVSIQSDDGWVRSNSTGRLRPITGVVNKKRGQNEDVTEHSPLLGDNADGEPLTQMMI